MGEPQVLFDVPDVPEIRACQARLMAVRLVNVVRTMEAALRGRLAVVNDDGIFVLRVCEMFHRDVGVGRGLAALACWHKSCASCALACELCRLQLSGGEFCSCETGKFILDCGECVFCA